MSVQEMMKHIGFPDAPIIDIMKGASERVLFEACRSSRAIDDDQKFSELWVSVRQAISDM